MGGNVRIGNVEAQRIDLTKIDRTKIVSSLSKALAEINTKFQSLSGPPIWSKETLSSRSFLSGSAFHFFDINTIPNAEFVARKRTVGDVDTQVDITMADVIKRFLTNLPQGTQVGPLVYVGYKTSIDQFITLWNLPEFNINVQIDMELVEFQNGSPTEWSRFSHGSAWEDIQNGVKGVFSKYLMRAFQARTAQDVIIVPHSPRGKDKIVHTSDLAFSTRGLRTKLEPVLDASGKQQMRDGKPVYREIDTKESAYITDFDSLFVSFFGRKGSVEEIKKMGSFVGLLGLVRDNFSETEKEKVVSGFAQLLWGKDAQGLVRDGPQEDFDTKKVAFDILTRELGGSINNFQDLISSFYDGYK